MKKLYHSAKKTEIKLNKTQSVDFSGLKRELEDINKQQRLNGKASSFTPRLNATENFEFPFSQLSDTQLKYERSNNFTENLIEFAQSAIIESCRKEISLDGIAKNMRETMAQKEGGKWLLIIYQKFVPVSLAYNPCRTLTFTFHKGEIEYIIELAQTEKRKLF